MQLNNGKFEYNNKCGYLLKPEIMRCTTINRQFDPFAESPIDGIVATTLKIRILSGLYIPDANKHFGQSVTLELFGLPADSVRNNRSHRVKATASSSIHVSYANSTGYTFKKIIMPQLATLAFTVFDEQGKIFGRRFLPVTGLRPGYRYINLKSESNQPMNMCALFVHIVLQDYVPDHLEELANALVDPISYVHTQEKKEEMLRTLCEESDVIADDQNGLDNDEEVPGEAVASAKSDLDLTPLQIALRDQKENKKRMLAMRSKNSEGKPSVDSGQGADTAKLRSKSDELDTDWKQTYAANAAHLEGRSQII